MLPVRPTEKLMLQNQDLHPVNITAPKDVPEEECGDLVALHGYLKGGATDGWPVIKTYWQPSDLELQALKNGAVIELVFFDGGMPMTAMNVETVE